MKTLLFVLASLVAVESVADIYKSIDENGNTVYSDRPQPGAEKVDLPPATTYSPPPLPPVLPKSTETAPAIGGELPIPKDGAPALTAYAKLVIVEPALEATIWNTGGIVPVAVVLEPELDAAKGHRIAVDFNGERLPAELTKNQEFTLTGVERGTHTLQAHVIDASGKKIISTGPITFYVKQGSALAPTRGNKPPIPGVPALAPAPAFRPYPVPGANDN